MASTEALKDSSPIQAHRPGPWPGREGSLPLPPSSSWANRSGFKTKFSGETNVSESEQIVSVQKPKEHDHREDPEANPVRPPLSVNGVTEGQKILVPSDKDQAVKLRRNSDGSAGGAPKSSLNGEFLATQVGAQHRRVARGEEITDVLPTVADHGAVLRNSHMKYELRDTPGLVPIGLYGLQHYISMIGSLILIPLVIVPAMGGSQEDTATVVSTVLLLSGVTTLLHTCFGSRLPLIQGPSFVYLAPALAIINSPEFVGLNENNFKHIMKELQGAIIIASAFQATLGYSGLMSIFLRLFNPVVVSPTIAAVGLSFYSYGFPLVGTCLEIGVIQILLVIIFSLYLRKISIFGHRVFLIYAVLLGLSLTWATAFFLTEAGVYSYQGCDVNVPTSNIISEHCRKHLPRMKQCRVDTSHALRSSPWVKFPYPLQWGTPVFHWKMALVMCVASIISSVDSVGSYHASSLLVAKRPPTPGVLSRGVGLEGLCSILAGLWGTGTGFATLTENVHTIAVTKNGSRRSVQLGALILILLSFVGKVGGLIASIPQVMVSALLCFMWAMLTALGLSNLRYSEAGSSRNVIIVGLSLFFALSVPAYVQQYGVSPYTNLSVPGYFQAYIAASHGPVHTNFPGVNYVLNTLLSLHMVIAFVVAAILDTTVPGSRQERGVYVWSEPEDARQDPDVCKDYELAFRLGKAFRWVKWVGI